MDGQDDSDGSIMAVHGEVWLARHDGYRVQVRDMVDQDAAHVSADPQVAVGGQDRSDIHSIGDAPDVIL